MSKEIKARCTNTIIRGDHKRDQSDTKPREERWHLTWVRYGQRKCAAHQSKQTCFMSEHLKKKGGGLVLSISTHSWDHVTQPLLKLSEFKNRAFVWSLSGPATKPALTHFSTHLKRFLGMVYWTWEHSQAPPLQPLSQVTDPVRTGSNLHHLLPSCHQTDWATRCTHSSPCLLNKGHSPEHRWLSLKGTGSDHCVLASSARGPWWESLASAWALLPGFPMSAFHPTDSVGSTLGTLFCLLCDIAAFHDLACISCSHRTTRQPDKHQAIIFYSCYFQGFTCYEGLWFPSLLYLCGMLI